MKALIRCIYVLLGLAVFSAYSLTCLGLIFLSFIEFASPFYDLSGTKQNIDLILLCPLRYTRYVIESFEVFNEVAWLEDSLTSLEDM